MTAECFPLYRGEQASSLAASKRCGGCVARRANAHAIQGHFENSRQREGAWRDRSKLTQRLQGPEKNLLLFISFF
jgi:hypothetical protein